MKAAASQLTLLCRALALCRAVLLTVVAVTLLIALNTVGAQTGTLTVTNTNDGGAGSLRQALLDSNATAGTQTITFNIPGAGVQTITPVSQLPSVTDPVVIDGYTQPGASANTLSVGDNAVLLIEIDGTNASQGLNITAGSSTLRGLVINRGSGIILSTGGGNTIAGCFVGTNATGTAPFAAAGGGVQIINSPNNVIGGTAPADRNVISGNNLGLRILSAGSTGNSVQGNYIGTNAAGTAALSTNSTGVAVNGANNNAIGGTLAGAGNLVSGHLNYGIVLVVAHNNTIQGNLVGTDAAGMGAIPNRHNSGIGIESGSTNNLIGGTLAGARNVISGNDGSGVEIVDSGSTGNRVEGNYIGVAADGTTALGNTGTAGIGGPSSGVEVYANASGNTVGGTTAAAANVIAFNAGHGVSVAFDATGARVIGNSIFNNGRLGIDLGADGVTANDVGDPDAGANNLQNFPLLSAATGGGAGTTIQGALGGTANTPFTIEFFSNPACDPSGNGEGQTFLGSQSVTTDATGNAVINATLAAATAAGQFVTATATDPAGNTSEFSGCAAASASEQGLTISGRVTDGAGGAGLAGVVVTLSGALSRTTQTDASGNYAFTNLAPGFGYSVTVQSPHHGFAQQRADVPNLSASQTVNFTSSPQSPPVVLPPPSDSFDGPQRDPAKWNLGTLTQPAGAFDPQVTVSQQNGQLVISPLANVSGPHYNGYVSVSSFDLTGGHISVEVPQVARNGAETIFSVGTGPDDYFRFVVRGAGGGAGAAKFGTSGPLDAAAQLVLVFEVKVGGVLAPAPPVSVPYDPVLHRFWRFRHDAPANSIVFETSPDNVAYAERFRKTLEKGVSALVVELSAGTAQAVADPGQARFDNLSLVTATAQFSAADFQAGEGEGRATVTVTRSGNVSGAATLVYRTEDADAFTVGCADAAGAQGNAFARCDFATAVGTLQFAAGETSKSFTVPLIDDGHAEGAETFSLKLVQASGASLGAPALIRVTIQDNDSAGAANPVTSSQPFFVRQQYLDFLSREPDQAGFDAWLGVLNTCPNPNTGPEVQSGCDRIFVSGEGFFRSVEFQLKGAYVFRLYKASFNRLPEYTEIVSDMSFIAGATQAEVFARRAEVPVRFTQRQEFQNLYGGMTNAQYVAALLGRHNLSQVTTPDPANPDAGQKVTLTAAELTSRLDSGSLTRAQVLRAVADSDQVTAAEFDAAFVAMQYYGYLRRKPEPAGYEAWLRVLQAGDTRTMVNGFLNSAEYRLRFGPAQ